MTLPDFPTFYAALHSDVHDGHRVHGRAPFAWQVRAAAELADNGWWPALTAPTGAGKTTLIEAWLHALSTAGSARLGRRLFWVVDRRTVIDQVFEHADAIVTKLLADDAEPALQDVASRLREIGGGADPVCALWRGGIDEAAGRDAREPLDPGRVACVCSTVDQIGSRLLFRGYGIAPGSRAIHAGLAGIDATIILDEAHIATDFLATADAVARFQTQARQSPGPPLRVVEVTATPRTSKGFQLSAAERTEPAIARRITARKRVRLAKRGQPVDAVAAAQALAEADPRAAIGVVLNTVGEARAVFDELAAVGVAAADRTLVIGPVRPLDRPAVLACIPPRAARPERRKPFFVVATQTIEVGLDLDLDGLVTACAPVPSLVQRLGRLDRRGVVGDTAAVVLPPPRRGCPIYGDASSEAFSWLAERLDGAGEVDLGPAAIERLRRAVPLPVPTAGRPAPVLQPPHVEALSRTEASDAEVPEVELFLHGDRDTSADVSLVWRADLGEDDDEDRVGDRLGLRPPHAGEALTVSLRVAMRWLSGRDAGPFADLPSTDDGAADERVRRDLRTAWVVRRNGRASPEIAAVSLTARRIHTEGDGGRDGRLRPGDIVVLAATAGGADEFGWAPRSIAPVADLGSLDPGRPRVVLSERAPGAAAAIIARVRDGLEGGNLTASDAASELASIMGSGMPADERYEMNVEAAAGQLADGQAELLPDGEILVTMRRQPERARAWSEAATLANHQRAVAKRVAAITAAVGLDSIITDQLMIAARHHDEGKRDPRFQTWLSSGVPVAEPLAKSSYVATRRRVRALRDAAGWPVGKRHEVASALLMRQRYPHAILAAWLVATHHGANRPFPHAVRNEESSGIEVRAEIDGRPAAVEANAGLGLASQLDAFERLSAEHGAWGLAYLEAILVFADREVSGTGR